MVPKGPPNCKSIRMKETFTILEVFSNSENIGPNV